jgi:D-sedoheptulose 7-phosphate isomerase
MPNRARPHDGRTIAAPIPLVAGPLYHVGMNTYSVRAALSQALDVLAAFRTDEQLVAVADRAADLLAQCLRSGCKILICGNGGSLCDGAHFAEELTGRFRADRRPLPAIACADPGHITCTANDYGFEEVFARWIDALAKAGDVVVLLSTSGNSANIIRAAERARSLNLTTIALLGKGGGRLAGRCSLEIIVPGETSDRIQELHMLILHAWVEGIEARLALAQVNGTESDKKTGTLA